ncbi:integrase [Pandoraea horticolens]|uniref:Integrase n=1 Tax=Pandoraea horticolens TaxID=2508298 RepID=A0A5E4R8S6_9BURK|nr:hypothetical protein [Pandoraea horticolens]VVD59014.1 integrase [Pandoraea horticolens]
MSAILNFVPRTDRAARENLDQFLAFCKSKLGVFGHDLDFDKDVWDITSHVSIRGAEAKVIRLHFSSFDSRQAKVPQPMCPDIGAFAKSYIRYTQGLSPIVGFGPRLAALRMLDKAWAEVGGIRGLDELNGLVLNRAAQIATDNFGVGAAYRVGQQLEMIASFLIDMRLVTGNFTWRNPMSRPNDTQRVGAEFDARRFSKLPSDAAMSALPQIFRSAITPADVIFSAITAILCAAPSRISEVLTLPLDCEVNQPERGGTLTKYGLRWWPAKGAPPMTKFVVGAMSEVVAEAILRIRRMTDDARAVAKWYETHPNQLYLPEDLEPLRASSHVTLTEVANIVGVSGSAAASLWCRSNGIKYSGTRGERNVSLASVSRAIISMLPEGFPYIDRDRALKYSEALFVVLRNQVGAQRGTYRGMIEPLSSWSSPLKRRTQSPTYNNG